MEEALSVGQRKPCHIVNGQPSFEKYMCVDGQKCKEANAFFCDGCSERHTNHRFEKIDSTDEFSKKLRRLTQYDELLEQFQTKLQEVLSRNNRMTDAAFVARLKLMKAAGTWKQEYKHDNFKMIRLFKEKLFHGGATAQSCESFRSFVLSINYKELSTCISNIKKAVDRVQQPSYLADLVLKIFTFESGSKEMYNQIQLDLAPIAGKAVESKVDLIKRRLSHIQEALHDVKDLNASRREGSMNVSDAKRLEMDDVMSELDSLISKKDIAKKVSQCTDQFEVGESSNIDIKINGRILLSKIHPQNSTVSTMPGSKLRPEVETDQQEAKKIQSAAPNSSKNNERLGSSQVRIPDKMKSSRSQVQISDGISADEKNRLIREMQELKGNFSEFFASGNKQLRWEVLRCIDLYSNTKILRLSKNQLEDVTSLNSINLKNLKYLHLNDNLINSFGQLEGVDFKNLQVLSLDNNKIRDFGPLERVNLRCLQVLSVNGNLIDSFDGLEKVNFKVLQGLALSSNQLEDPKPLKNIDYKGMFWIELKNNPFDKDNLEWLKKLTIKNKSGAKLCIYV